MIERFARRAVALRAAVAAAYVVLAASCDPSDWNGSPAAAQRPVAVEIRTVRSTSPLGVPLHPSERSSEVSGRIPNGATVRVLAWSADRRWLEVESDAGRGFVVVRYVETGAPRPAAPPSPFDSREGCERAAHAAPARHAGAGLRIASWNVRWFPDGDDGRASRSRNSSTSNGPSARATDVRWLACAIASLDADVVAVQEFVRHAQGRAAIDALLGALGARTGATWRAVFDHCPADGRQHVGFLYREDRVRLDAEPSDVGGMNGDLRTCGNRLRPGLLARMSAASGAPLHVDVLNLHLDSGVLARDHAHREGAMRAIRAMASAPPYAGGGRALVVLGDFNTMGCETCPTPVRAADEIARWLHALGEAGLVRAEPTASCTERGTGRSATLDHAFVLAAPGTAPSGTLVARVLGPCAASCTVSRRGPSPFDANLSDHCPIVVDVP